MHAPTLSVALTSHIAIIDRDISAVRITICSFLTNIKLVKRNPSRWLFPADLIGFPLADKRSNKLKRPRALYDHITPLPLLLPLESASSTTVTIDDDAGLLPSIGRPKDGHCGRE